MFPRPLPIAVELRPGVKLQMVEKKCDLMPFYSLG
jgi:hypothetical protein